VAISFGKKLAGAALAAAVALGAGTAAMAAGGGGAAAASTAPAGGALAAKAAGTAGAKVKGAGILRRADHGDIEVQVKAAKGAPKTWETITFDKGTVTDVAADHISVARPDGQSVTLKIDATTKFHGVTDVAGVQKDKPAIVLSKAGVATQILQAKPKA
jgi:hypothetical protein